MRLVLALVRMIMMRIVRVRVGWLRFRRRLKLAAALRVVDAGLAGIAGFSCTHINHLQ